VGFSQDLRITDSTVEQLSNDSTVESVSLIQLYANASKIIGWNMSLLMIRNTHTVPPLAMVFFLKHS
jgi:hypothetical protein